MEIRIRETGAVVFDGEFRAMHSNTSLPSVLSGELLDSLGADPVLEGPQATVSTPYQYSMRQGVEEINGQWFTKYVPGPIFMDRTNEEDGTVVTAAEQEAEHRARIDEGQATAVRAERNRKLAESDWTQVADTPVNQAAWAAYRQALRDITAQPGFPWSVQWPQQPVA